MKSTYRQKAQTSLPSKRAHVNHSVEQTAAAMNDFSNNVSVLDQTPLSYQTEAAALATAGNAITPQYEKIQQNRKSLKTQQGCKVPQMNIEMVGLQTLDELQQMQHVTPTHFSAIDKESIYGRTTLTPIGSSKPGTRNQGNLKYRNQLETLRRQGGKPSMKKSKLSTDQNSAIDQLAMQVDEHCQKKMEIIEKNQLKKAASGGRMDFVYKKPHSLAVVSAKHQIMTKETLLREKELNDKNTPGNISFVDESILETFDKTDRSNE